MDPVNTLIGGAIAAVILVFLFFISRQKPSTARQRFALENPLMRKWVGSEVILERLGTTPGMRVLEVGCGGGRLAIPLARRVGSTGEVVAIDTQERLLTKLRKVVKFQDIANIKPMFADIETVGLEKESFDRVVMSIVLGDVADPKKAMRNVARMLKPGGVVSITEFAFTTHYISRTRLKKLMMQVGLELDHQFGGWLGYTVNYVKPALQEDPWRQRRPIDLT